MPGVLGMSWLGTRIAGESYHLARWPLVSVRRMSLGSGRAKRMLRCEVAPSVDSFIQKNSNAVYKSRADTILPNQVQNPKIKLQQHARALAFGWPIE